MAHPKILAFVLAGGKGKRPAPLTEFRSEPAVPFGGRYRVVDFVQSNLVNSQIHSIYLLIRYKSQSLVEHVRRNWVLSSMIRDHAWDILCADLSYRMKACPISAATFDLSDS